LVLLLSSCSIFDQLEDTYEQRFSEDVATIQDLQSTELKNVPLPKISPVVAVYPASFSDQTGQRKATASLLCFLQQLLNNPTHFL